MRVVTDWVLLACAVGLAVLGYELVAHLPTAAPKVGAEEHVGPATMKRVASRPGFVPRRPASGSRPATRAAAALTLRDARFLAQELALNSPNPLVRDSAYRDHDGNWSFDVSGRTFSLTLQTPQATVAAGKFQQSPEGFWWAGFNDPAALAQGWAPPAEPRLTAEQARILVVAACSALPQDAHLQGLGPELKTADLVQDPDGRNVKATTQSRSTCRIDLQERTFSLDLVNVDVVFNYSGRFGWDKNRQWVAWFTRGGLTTTAGGINHRDFLITPATPPAEGTTRP